jgi:Nif-specific regulatory protein
MKQTINTIPAKTMDCLLRYHWPSIIRELQNVIERTVILSTHRTAPATAMAIPVHKEWQRHVT